MSARSKTFRMTIRTGSDLLSSPAKAPIGLRGCLTRASGTSYSRGIRHTQLNWRSLQRNCACLGSPDLQPKPGAFHSVPANVVPGMLIPDSEESDHDLFHSLGSAGVHGDGYCPD